jgi:predicted DNA-binding transcriptional regulator
MARSALTGTEARIIALLRLSPGLTAREINDRLGWRNPNCIAKPTIFGLFRRGLLAREIRETRNPAQSRYLYSVNETVAGKIERELAA